MGIGVLFGLTGYRYDFVGLMMHAEHMEAALGVGPHTISVPRIRPADDIDPTEFADAVPDDRFLHIVAVIRCAVPYTGMIVSTRESEAVRARLLDLGISQISGGSRTSVGGYTEKEYNEDTAQFNVADHRTLDEVVDSLMSLGYIPSFCTACYRAGRTGERFMKICKSGKIQDCCTPNALLTLKEYLVDYASPSTKEKGERIIAAEVAKLQNPALRRAVLEDLLKIENGERDLRF